MQRERIRPAVKRNRFLLLFMVAATLFFSQAALAQSGRRQNKSVSSPSSPPVTSEPQTDSATNPPTVKPAPSVSVIVGGDRLGSSGYALSGYVDVAVEACMDRLKDSSGLEVIGGGNMTRKDAIDRAKKGQKAYVLWLELRVEDNVNDYTALIGYTLFMPQTGKVATSGRVYLGERTAGVGRVGVGLPSVTKRLPLQYQLRDGGREVAARVKGKLQARPTD